MRHSEVHSLIPDAGVAGTAPHSGLILCRLSSDLFDRVLAAKLDAADPRATQDRARLRRSHTFDGATAFIDAAEADLEGRRECAAGAGWPACGCASQCDACWPRIVVQRDRDPELLMVRCPPDRHASLSAAAAALGPAPEPRPPSALPADLAVPARRAPASSQAPAAPSQGVTPALDRTFG